MTYLMLEQLTGGLLIPLFKKTNKKNTYIERQVQEVVPAVITSPHLFKWIWPSKWSQVEWEVIKRNQGKKEQHSYQTYE